MVTLSPLSLHFHHLLPKSIKTLLLNPNPNPNQNPKTNVKLTSRRDASAAVLSALILPHLILQPQENLALAAAGPTVSECEFTVTPSGLGFCDQVVGTGAAASKGQLIKVSLFHLYPHKYSILCFRPSIGLF